MGDIAELYDWGDPDMWELRQDAPAKCRYCGARIQWKHEERWRAYTLGGKHHVCKPFLKTIRSTPMEDFK